ncbi:MFS transporter [Rhodococcus sp. IEGM 1366]|uniref:MFS transporter n=1 Tax=Rhodococcus sp. IEGM 1366 TaxID=3082223 RepID=UPI002953E937|nr:MFS transporter [Rhodococcus sp. IEGM 1366]MDV8071358.1 MFS transporter [Rhodococcus sp. IEGM 1366]
MPRPSRTKATPTFLILTALIVAEAIAAFETTMAIQLLYADDPFFKQDITKLVWIVTAYMLVAAAATGVCGRLGDQFGRKQVLITVLIISSIGSMVSALAPNLEILILGRAIQGVSGAVLPLVIGLARQVLPKDKAAIGISVVSASALIAGASGMVVGGLILDYFQWHLIFWFASTVAILACIAVWAWVPGKSPEASTGSTSRIDYLGAVLFSATTATILFGVTRTKDLGWTDQRVLMLLGGGTCLLLAWIAWELTFSAPMMDLRRFANPKFTLGMIATAAAAIGPFGMMQVLPTAILRTPTEITIPGTGENTSATVIDLPIGFGLTATATGLLLGLSALVGFLISPLPGRISRRLGASITVIIGSLISTLGFIATWLAHTSLPAFLACSVVVGIGASFLYGGLPTLIAECVPESQTSAAVGMQAVVRTTFQGVASSIAGLFLAQGAVNIGSHAFPGTQGIQTTLYFAAGVSLIACALAYLASRKRETDSDDLRIGPMTHTPESAPLRG